jgi:hypothetical protein
MLNPENPVRLACLGQAEKTTIFTELCLIFSFDGQVCRNKRSTASEEAVVRNDWLTPYSSVSTTQYTPVG